MRIEQDDPTITRAHWVSMGAVLIGTFMVALDQTIVTIALPQIGQGLGATQGIDWVVTAYLLALGVVQPTTGWLADRMGRKNVFLTSVGLFTFGSILSGLAPSLTLLVAARIIQGLGGGAIFPVGMAMMYEQFPRSRRGMALGIWSVGLTVAPAVGPVLGGLIVTQWDWRWLFFINVPIGLVGLLVGARVLPRTGFKDIRPFDGRGVGLVAIALGAGLFALSEANTWGWTAPSTLLLFGLSAVLLAWFVGHELHAPEPVIDVRIFGIRTFSLSLLIVAGLVVVQFGRLVFVPLELESWRGLSALDVGLLLVPAAITAAIAAPVAGRLSDRIGARPLVLAGLAITGLAALLLADVQVDTPIWAIGTVIAVQGLGNGLAMTPNTVAGMNALPQHLIARGTAVRSSIRQVSASFGVAALTALAVARGGGLALGAPGVTDQTIQATYGVVFLASAFIMLACLPLALLLPSSVHGLIGRSGPSDGDRVPVPDVSE
ncbi:MAG: DHA2 family efflux MFS transporter permease subunit [Candidatus Limnocylindrales bacterium]